MIAQWEIPLGAWAEALVDWALTHGRPIFDGVSISIGWLTGNLESLLLGIPSWLIAFSFAALAWRRVGRGFCVFTLVGFALVLGMELWEATLSTFALALSATVFSLLVGLPLGILGAKSEMARRLTRPVLDLMQTMPAFVYLIPAAMFFGLGKTPGVIATIIFSMPPVIRLTELGIRQVPRETIEAGIAFGCDARQLLTKVELPNAMPSIMAGVNQNIMLALSMTVIASMIGAGGLGNEVLKGIQRLDVGAGFEGGIGVVFLAVLLDRLTQSYGVRKSSLSETD